MALARRALAAGAHGVAAYVPWFYPITQEQVRAHFLALLEAAGDAPAFLYNIPPRTVNDLSPELAGELARAGFTGMKDSTGDFDRHREYLAAVDGSFEVYTGTEQLIVESVAAGPAGACAVSGAAMATASTPAVRVARDRARCHVHASDEVMIAPAEAGAAQVGGRGAGRIATAPL